MEKSFAITNVGISQLNSTSGISIYPNPVHNLLHIENQNSIEKTVQVEIMDMAGKKVLGKKLENRQEQIDVSNIRKGIYAIIIRSNEFIRTEKLVIR